MTHLRAREAPKPGPTPTIAQTFTADCIALAKGTRKNWPAGKQNRLQSAHLLISQDQGEVENKNQTLEVTQAIGCCIDQM